MRDVKIHETWKKVLDTEFYKPYWGLLTTSVRTQYSTTVVYPPARNVFAAFDLCPFDEVKVVIVGQDPYHGVGQANGLSFSVNDGVTLPPSLRNIFKEIRNDTGVTPLPSGDLSRWATQGVLMLNTNRAHIVYLLWGKYAQTKGAVINRSQNLVLTSGHPSPYSESLFFNKHHFSQCNQYLTEQGIAPIDWR